MEQNNQRLCKNKNCRKPLPENYKHKYCEACRNEHANTAGNVGKGLLSVAGIALTIVTAGKIRPKK